MAHRRIPRIDLNTQSNNISSFENLPESTLNYQINEYNAIERNYRLRPSIRNRFRPYRNYNTVDLPNTIDETTFSEVDLGEPSSVNNVPETIVDIPESIPLLTGGVGSAVVDGGVVSSLPSVAAGAVLTAGASILGYVASSVIGGKGATLPSSDYIGPGNPVPISAAKNKADQIAKVHDVEYGEIAKSRFPSRQDHLNAVSAADKKAIKAFQEEGSINSRIGSVGLQVKRKFESSIGRAVYPSYKVGKAPNKPPWEKNPERWDRMNNGQKRYSYEQWALSMIRRGLTIDHPFPGDGTDGVNVGADSASASSQPDSGSGNDDAGTSIDDRAVAGPSGESLDPQPAEDQPPGKKPRTDESPEPDINKTPSMSGSSQGQGGISRPSNDREGRAGNANGSQLLGTADSFGTVGNITVPRPISVTTAGPLFFRKVHRFLSYGLAPKIVTL